MSIHAYQICTVSIACADIRNAVYKEPSPNSTASNNDGISLITPLIHKEQFGQSRCIHNQLASISMSCASIGCMHGCGT